MFLENKPKAGDQDSVTTSPVKPIFVVGTPRSGTTLTAKILGKHPDVCLLGESNFFEDVWSRREELGSLRSATEVQAAVDRLMTLFDRYYEPETQKLVDQLIKPKALVETIMCSGGGYGTLYMVFMGTLAKACDAYYTCDDTPKHLFYLREIFELFPQAKVIVCTRDIRDFLLSYQNWWRRSPSSARIRVLYHPIMTSLLWRSSMNVALASLNEFSSEQVLLQRYEDLVASPQIQVQRICEFLQIQYIDELLQLDSHNSSFESNNTGIFSSSVGRWRRELAPEEVWWAQRLGSHNMARLGYASAPIQPSYARLFLDIATLPKAFVVAMRANTNHRGPVWQYLWRRIVHLFRT